MGKVTSYTPGKLKRLSRKPCGDVLGGGVALTLGGLLCWKCAGEEGVEEVADEGLLLESSWLILGTGSSKYTESISITSHYFLCTNHQFFRIETATVNTKRASHRLLTCTYPFCYCLW